MKTFQKYIIKRFLITIFIITVIITGIVCTTQLLSLLYLFEKGIKLTHFLMLIGLIIPSLLFIVLPLTVSIAIIYLYNYLDNNRQLVILRVIGLNDFNIAKPAIIVAIFVMFCSYFISLSLMPLSQTILRNNLYNLKENYISNLIKENSFNQVSKFVNIYVGQKLQNDQFKDLAIFDNTNYDRPIIHLAKYGMLKMHQNQPILIISQGTSQFYDQNYKLINLEFKTLMVELDNNSKRISDNRTIAEYYLPELLQPNDELPQKRKFRMITEGHQRIIWPLYSFILPFTIIAIGLKFHLKQLKTYFYILSYSLIVLYIHFMIQNLAYSNLNYIYLMYINLLLAFIIGIRLHKTTGIIPKNVIDNIT